MKQTNNATGELQSSTIKFTKPKFEREPEIKPLMKVADSRAGFNKPVPSGGGGMFGMFKNLFGGRGGITRAAPA